MNQNQRSSEAAFQASSSSGERESVRSGRDFRPPALSSSSADSHAAYAAERAEAVERRIAGTRLAVMAFAAFVYVFLVDQRETVAWLAYAILVCGWAYALVVYFVPRQERFAPRAPTWVTSFVDACLLNLWLFATGGVHSDFYVVIYSSVIAVAFQSGYRAAVIAAGLYATTYVLLLALLGQLIPHFTEVAVRAGFVFLIAPLGGLLAREALEQGSAKLEMEDLARTARRAEEEREKSIGLLRATFEATADGILVQDEDGRIVRFNDRCREMWRVPDEVVSSRDERRVLSFVLTQIRDPDSLVAKLRELGRNPDQERFELIEFNDGRVFECHSRPQRVGGKNVGRVWSFSDNTSRRRAELALAKSEKRYRTLFEESKDAVFISIPGGRLVDVNSAAVEMFGFSSKEEMLQVPSWDFLLSDGDLQAGRELMMQQGFVRDFEVEAKRKDGERITLLVTASAARDEQGNVVEVRGVSRDVTGQRRLEAQFRQSQKLEAVGRLAAGVAHEVNNPLTYVLSHLEALKKELPDLTKNPALQSEASARVSEALEGAERVRRIVRDLKSFSRVDDEQKTIVDLNLAVEKSVRLAANQIRQRARLVQELGEGPRVLADEGRISQVVLNLVMNAAQAIEERHADRNEIRLRTWVSSAEAFLEIADTGKGIPPEHLEKLFDPFFTTKPVGEGLGLGLAICHNIVTSYGGQIDVESTPGAGSRFVARFPLAPPEARSVPSAPEKTERPRQDSRRGRILVVDDEPLVRSAAAMILRGKHEVIEAGSGREALAIIDRDPGIDAVLCDLMMPDTSGAEVYRALVDRSPELARRIVFMTGGAFTRGAEEFLRQVPNSSVDKPFAAADLLAVIQNAIAAPRSGGESGS